MQEIEVVGKCHRCDDILDLDGGVNHNIGVGFIYNNTIGHAGVVTSRASPVRLTGTHPRPSTFAPVTISAGIPSTIGAGSETSSPSTSPASIVYVRDARSPDRSETSQR